MPPQDGVSIGDSNLGLERKKIDPLWWRAVRHFPYFCGWLSPYFCGESIFLFMWGVNLLVSMGSQYPCFCGGRSPQIQTTSRFDLITKRSGKSSGIFLSRISKNFEELVERKFVEGIKGLRALFGIKLKNILEANVDDIEGK